MCEKKGIYFAKCMHYEDWVDWCANRPSCVIIYPPQATKPCCCSSACCNEDIDKKKKAWDAGRRQRVQHQLHVIVDSIENVREKESTQTQSAYQTAEEAHTQCDARRAQEPTVPAGENQSYYQVGAPIEGELEIALTRMEKEWLEADRAARADDRGDGGDDMSF